MRIKEQKGVTTVDIVISVLMITIFITIIGNMINSINLNSIKTERKSTAMSYAVREIEKIKGQGYLDYYDGQGITEKEILKDDQNELQDIDIYENEEFTGYHKTINIEDYVFIAGDETKEQDVLKKITVEISYKLSGKTQTVSLSAYIVRE